MLTKIIIIFWSKYPTKFHTYKSDPPLFNSRNSKVNVGPPEAYMIEKFLTFLNFLSNSPCFPTIPTIFLVSL